MGANVNDRVLKVPDHVVFRAFPAETVILNLNTGMYHGLNPTAGRMLETLRDRRDLDAVARAVADEFSVPVERVRADLDSLVSDLVARGLLVEDDGPAETDTAT
jgi:hypothetical protein